MSIKRKQKWLNEKQKIYFFKIIILIIALIIKNQIDTSNEFKWIKNALFQIKGIKLYSLFKIIEYILLLLNKFGHDLDLQVIKIIFAKKLKHKIISFLLLIIFLYLDIYILILFYYCSWLIIYDNNKNFVPIYLKVNYIEFKQSNKSFKSIHTFLSNDIHDRFLNYFVLFFIIINGLTEGRLKINYNNIFLRRIFFCFISEFLSDYLKAIILFKLNNINPKNIKFFLREEIIYFGALKNKKKNLDNKYYFLKDYKLYDYYSDVIDEENIMSMILNINIFPFFIIIYHYLLFKLEVNFYFKIICLFLLIGLKILNETIIGYFITNENNKKISKSEFSEKNLAKTKNE